MKPREWYFYAAVGAAIAFSEMSVHFGFLYCLAIPMAFAAVVAGFWAFRN